MTIASQEDFDNIAAQLHEAEMEAFWRKCQFALLAEEAKQKKRAGHWWFCASGTVSTLARYAKEFPEEWRLCDIPRNLPSAIIACVDEHQHSPKPWRREAWWWMKVAHRFRLSARQLKDLADVGQRNRVSNVARVNNEAIVMAWESWVDYDGYSGGHIELNVPNWEPSGDPPERVRVRAVEVLTE